MKEDKSVKLTKQAVEGLTLENCRKKPSDQQAFKWDSELKGFGVRVTLMSKTYIVQARDKDGETCRITIGKHGVFTADQARKEAIKRLAEIATSSNPNKAKKDRKREKRTNSITLAEVWEQYQKARSLRPTTLHVYKNALNRCFPDWLSEPITKISKDMVEKRHRELSNQVGPRSNADGAKAQANQAMRVLRSILNFAASGSDFEDADGRSILPENPVKRLSQRKAWNRNIRREGVIHKSQLKDWYKAVKDFASDTIGDYLILCLLTGLRRNEAAQLTWANVNFDEGYLRIEADKAKNHNEHRLPLTDKLTELLQGRERTGKYVFPGRSGGDTHLVESKFTVARVADKSKVKFMVHDLRRTFLTIAESLDVPHYTLKKLANHKSTSDVTGGYIVTDVERLRAPMQAITDYIMVQVGEKKPAQEVAQAKKPRAKRTSDTHKKLEVVG
jgi:Phage integrase family.